MLRFIIQLIYMYITFLAIGTLIATLMYAMDGSIRYNSCTYSTKMMRVEALYPVRPTACWLTGKIR
jgi:hypothetical protein